ncbi:MAG: proton-translocating transhydrogenase family protein [Sphingobium sp.]
MTLLAILSILILACIVGYRAFRSAAPGMHMPLITVANAICSVVIIGALVATAEASSPVARYLGLGGIVLASVNIFGGFALARRLGRGGE